MNKVAELCKIVETGRTRIIRKGPVLFEMDTMGIDTGAALDTDARVSLTRMSISVEGAYLRSVPGDYGRMRMDALRIISDKLYGHLRTLLHEMQYKISNYESPEDISELIKLALNETELKDAEGNPI